MTTMTTLAAPRSRTLADHLPLPQVRWRSALLCVVFALLTAAAAQLTFILPWTPVPITGQTAAVLLSGAALGAKRGAASQAIYVLLGVVGLPFYADGQGGWTAATGATAGYLVGFIVAAAFVGWLAERRQDRHVITAVEAMIAGNAVIYLFGVTWLAYDLDISVAKAVELGLTPFIIGDAIKVAAVGLFLPLAWRIVGKDD